MCEFCTANDIAACVDCGKMVCADIEGPPDDVISPAYVSESGDGPLCQSCFAKTEATEEEADDDSAFLYEFDPYNPHEWE